MSSDSIVLLSFDCDRLQFRSYYLALIRAAQTHERVPGGLLSQVVGEAEYLKTDVCKTNGGGAFEPPVKPVKPVGDALTAESLSDFQLSKEMFDQYAQDTKRFKLALDASLKTAAQDFVVEDNDYKELHQLSIRDIVGSLYEQYGEEPHSADVSILKERLLTPFSPATMSIDQFISTHSAVHAHLRSINLEMNHFDKIDALEKALRPCMLYDRPIDHFMLTYPNVTDKNRNFLQFSKAIRDYAPKTNEATAASRGYSTAATVTAAASAPDVQALQQQMLNMQQHLVQLAQAIKSAGVVKQTAAAATTMEQPNAYCWTHGICWHSGKDCRTPDPNHVPTATATNKCGGSEREYRPRPFKKNYNSKKSS